MSSGCVLTKSSLLSWVFLSEGGSVDLMMPVGFFWPADGGRKRGEADRGADRVPPPDSDHHPARGPRGAAQWLSNGNRRQRWPGIGGSTCRREPAAVSLGLIPVQSCVGYNCKIYSNCYDLEVMRETIVHKQAGKWTLLFGCFVINRGGSARVEQPEQGWGSASFGDFPFPTESAQQGCSENSSQKLWSCPGAFQSSAKPILGFFFAEQGCAGAPWGLSGTPKAWHGGIERMCGRTAQGCLIVPSK